MSDYPTAVCLGEFVQKIVRAYPGEEGKDQLQHQLLYSCSRNGFSVPIRRFGRLFSFAKWVFTCVLL